MGFLWCCTAHTAWVPCYAHVPREALISASLLLYFATQGTQAVWAFRREVRGRSLELKFGGDKPSQFLVSFSSFLLQRYSSNLRLMSAKPKASRHSLVHEGMGLGICCSEVKEEIQAQPESGDMSGNRCPSPSPSAKEVNPVLTKKPSLASKATNPRRVK